MNFHTAHLNRLFGKSFHYAVGLREFLKRPLSLADCYALVRERVENREGNFLAQLMRAVYPNSHSPYRKLLEHASCEFEDVRSMVSRQGLEHTLRKLSDAGVYITIEEYKGKKLVERSGLSFEVRPEDFDNPCVVPSLEYRSSGTRSGGVRSNVDFDSLTDEAAAQGVSFDDLGLYGAPSALWHASLILMLRAAKIGMPYDKWFFPLANNKHKLASYYAVVVGRALGCSLPWPERTTPQEAHKVAAWLAEKRSVASSIVVVSSASSAVRASLAARELGLDISGTHFITSGEPLTPAREKEIGAAGCKVTARYATNETGFIALGCQRSTGDELHLLNGHLAVIQQRRTLRATDVKVDAFQITSLLPSARKVLINMQNGDYGRLEGRACGCNFDGLGMTDHISHIRSFEKLTSEGMTFFAGDLVRIMEEVLPGRFGGSSLDYQAIEEEDKNGISHLTFLVSPKVGEINERDLLKTVLNELKQNGGSSRRMAGIWEEAGTLRVRREEPRSARGDKVFSFQVETGSA